MLTDTQKQNKRNLNYEEEVSDFGDLSGLKLHTLQEMLTNLIPSWGSKQGCGKPHLGGRQAAWICLPALKGLKWALVAPKSERPQDLALTCSLWPTDISCDRPGCCTCTDSWQFQMLSHTSSPKSWGWAWIRSWCRGGTCLMPSCHRQLFGCSPLTDNFQKTLCFKSAADHARPKVVQNKNFIS